MMAFIEITSVEEFNQKVLLQNGLSVVCFWAEWCAPCKVMSPELEQLAIDLNKEATFFSVNADLVKELCLTYDVEGIPTILLFKEGKELDRIAGYKKASVLEELIHELKG